MLFQLTIIVASSRYSTKYAVGAALHGCLLSSRRKEREGVWERQEAVMSLCGGSEEIGRPSTTLLYTVSTLCAAGETSTQYCYHKKYDGLATGNPSTSNQNIVDKPKFV